MNRENNCNDCREFGHIIKYYRNQRFIVQRRRIKDGNNHNMDNLKEEENLVVLD